MAIVICIFNYLYIFIDMLMMRIIDISEFEPLKGLNSGWSQSFAQPVRTGDCRTRRVSQPEHTRRRHKIRDERNTLT